MIRVEGLTADYDGEVILENVSFEIRRGELFVVLGRSGCGKTTLLKHLIGLRETRRGRILINGRDLPASQGEERREILRGIGVAYQSNALFGSMTLLENVRLPLEEFTRLPRAAMDAVAEMKLRLVGLEGCAPLMPAELSGGMRKRAAIARAMALDPAILFLDEPTAGLDPVTAAEIDQLLLRLKRNLGVTFVVISHELSSIYTIADRAIMLDRQAKGIVAEGDPRVLRETSSDPRVTRFFHRRAEADGTSAKQSWPFTP